MKRRRRELILSCVAATVVFGIVWTLAAGGGWLLHHRLLSGVAEGDSEEPAGEAPPADVSSGDPASRPASVSTLDTPTYVLFERSGPDPVRAVLDGKVAFAGAIEGLGGCVIVEHAGGLATTYASLEEVRVAAGAMVSAGDVVGTAGPAAGIGDYVLRFEVSSGETVAAPSLVLAGRQPEPVLFGAR